MTEAGMEAWDVGGWLQGLGLGQYEVTFRENEIDGDVLLELSEFDLANLGLPLGPRKRLLKAIAKLDRRQESAPAPLQVAQTALPPTSEVVGEWQHKTVMFCQLLDLAGTNARLNAEEWRDLICIYLDAALRAVTERDGKVAKKFGDGLVAYFGYPMAQENDAERAGGAGLAVQRALTELNRKNEGTGKLGARIVIESGPVMVDKPSEMLRAQPNLRRSLTTPLDPVREVIDRDFHYTLLRADAAITDAAYENFRVARANTESWRDDLSCGWQTEKWKPIATAPKDGRYIAVKRQQLEETVAWVPSREGWAVAYHPRDAERAILLTWDPTHWRLLSPPTRGS
jgi:hypothetical protein